MFVIIDLNLVIILFILHESELKLVTLPFSEPVRHCLEAIADTIIPADAWPSATKSEASTFLARYAGEFPDSWQTLVSSASKPWRRKSCPSMGDLCPNCPLTSDMS